MSRLREICVQHKAAIRELHRLDPWPNTRRIAAFTVIWLGAGWVALHMPALPVRLACYFAIGATIQGLVILMHEGVHGIMYRSPFWNRWAAFACGLPAFLSVTAYRVGHLPHHRHERGERDPDELENFTRDPRKLSALFCLTFLAGELFGFYRVGLGNAFVGKREERRAILVEYGIIVATFAAAFALVPIQAMLHLWVFPALFARQLTNVRTLSEHILTGHGDRFTVTRTVVSNRVVSFFMCNLNYHIEHHLFPGVPWYNLTGLHAVLRDELLRGGAQVYRSYTRFLLDLAKFMVRAWGPEGRRLPLRLAA